MSDDLIRPKYYVGRDGKTQALEVVANFQPENYNLGTALTYILRAGRKVYVNDSALDSSVADIEKAIEHLKAEAERLKSEAIKSKKEPEWAIN
jgi:uncharacterized small protein (DUF1192 family)